MTTPIQIQIRPRPEAMAGLRARGAWTRRNWKTIAHVNENRIERTRNELGALAPEALFEYRAIKKNPPSHLHIPKAVAQLGTVLDLTIEIDAMRITYEESDIGGLRMCSDPDAMDRPAGQAALYLLSDGSRRTNGGQNDGYCKCGHVLDRSTDAQCRHCKAGRPRPTLTPAQLEQKAQAWADSIEDADLNDRIARFEQTAATGGSSPVGARVLELLRARARRTMNARKRNENRNSETREIADAGATYEAWHEREPEQIDHVDDLPDVIGIFVGYALRIGYRSDKWAERGTTEDYDHDYTEPGYEVPEVWADTIDLSQARGIVIVGGNQRITADGID